MRIVVNMGLMTGQSPLPTLFRKKMDKDEINAEMFETYLSYFDHHVISMLLNVTMSERKGFFFTDWSLAQKRYLQLLLLSSSSALQFMMQRCLPAANIEVVKAPICVHKAGASTTIGKTLLGRSSFLGQDIEQRVPSYQVIFKVPTMHADNGEPWPIIIKETLRDVVLPNLLKTHIHLGIVLVVEENQTVAKLSTQALLGYSSLGEGSAAFRVSICVGYPVQLMEKLS